MSRGGDCNFAPLFSSFFPPPRPYTCFSFHFVNLFSSSSFALIQPYPPSRYTHHHPFQAVTPPRGSFILLSHQHVSHIFPEQTNQRASTGGWVDRCVHSPDVWKRVAIWNRILRVHHNFAYLRHPRRARHCRNHRLHVPYERPPCQRPGEHCT